MRKQSKEVKKVIVGIALLVVGVVLIWLMTSIWETNKAGNYQVKQAAYFGDLSVRNIPGTYFQWFGDITTYEIAGDIFLSKEKVDGGTYDGSGAVRVLFPNGFADVSFVGLYTIPLYDSIQKALHIRFNNNINLKYMITQQVIESLKNTGTLMSAEEAYSNKRSDFIRLAREQALVGLYESQVETDTVINAAGQLQETKRYSVKLGADGKPIIAKKSILATYDIELPQFNVKDMDFDEKLIDLIESRKDAQKAQQDAMTAKAKGETNIAVEKATQEVNKIKEVTIAQKLKEVAELDAEKNFKVAQFAAKQADENAKKIIAEGRAEAEANRLKVSAGLTPQEKAEWDYKTKVGVAAEMAKINLPRLMVIGGNGNNSPLNPFDAVGLKSFIEINEKMSK